MRRVLIIHAMSRRSLLPWRGTTVRIHVRKVQQFISLGPLDSIQMVETLHVSLKPNWNLSWEIQVAWTTVGRRCSNMWRWFWSLGLSVDLTKLIRIPLKTCHNCFLEAIALWEQLIATVKKVSPPEYSSRLWEVGRLGTTWTYLLSPSLLKHLEHQETKLYFHRPSLPNDQPSVYVNINSDALYYVSHWFWTFQNVM